MSVDYIMRETSDYIYSKGRYYKVPNSHMLEYQFSPNQEHLKMANTFTWKLGMKQESKTEVNKKNIGMATGQKSSIRTGAIL